MGDDLTEYPSRRLRLQECQFCGRQFNVESLNKHQSICRNVSKKKRKVFDAGKQRATGSDVPYKATKKTAQVYNGETRVQDERSKYGSKPNWREKHRQLIQSIREARSVTLAMKQGGPLPAFRPSEVPSDYVNCPYCRRNFNRHAAERHIPFCQGQHERKVPQPSRPNQQLERGRTLPTQKPSQNRPQQSYSTSAYSGSHDAYNNGYKHSNSAPMIARRNPPEYQKAPPPPPPPVKSSGGGGWSLRKFFGFGSKPETPPQSNYYATEDDDYYEPSNRRDPQQPVLMRTGRTQENTSLNVRARQRNDEGSSHIRRASPAKPAPSSYGEPRYQYRNSQPNPNRPTAVGRAPPPTSVRCGDCGSMFNNASARYCPHCGSRR
ncbi:unnamed protein product [Rotaria magnacalcarata]|uniref:C2HC/C3H-type domain-containing protein n=3 Tax=Rotaria magnacalcarata TaxID=392030 RepID=A0A816U036_9BILA|nr:unnamed protein product [Rotaria magnacalcarata]CAF1434911.1 unnamed protein product [Rotaria magnacalcarata]CAF2104381.1 unnamed protein product [Rotaria magnacalcarata]CAF2105962.1 unnamed protein product [Rotaria magnacalcarata]CAF2153234.1 unnamed protein product [Rotaria magnacalcarata]